MTHLTEKYPNDAVTPCDLAVHFTQRCPYCGGACHQTLIANFGQGPLEVETTEPCTVCNGTGFVATRREVCGCTFDDRDDAQIDWCPSHDPGPCVHCGSEGDHDPGCSYAEVI